MSQPPRKPGHSALRKGRASLAGGIYLITAGTIGRARVFDDFPVACIAARCFEDSTVLGSNRMLAWVLMPDHVHWVLRLGIGEQLAASVGRLKSASSRRVNFCLGRQGALWTPAFHDHALRREDDLRAIARYVVANPLRAVVRRVGDYPFWNAIWL
ncbi:REP-associated tyrosine transposase [Pseudomonas schmalbachii]|uniref:Transposase n=1 Tax=Pseudomonas schmalbachii TaxID=2816993 RepID=A0ABS3TWC6_9PSED|nr:transposase [Pseudomonas schmalbachii]MBO3277984.1 transposase [Pseudomonas schmalbachii]